MKKLLLGTFSLLFFATLCAKDITQQPTKTSPRFAFVCGLDGVLIKRNWLVIAKNISHLFLNASNRIKLLGLLTKPSFWKDCYQCFYHKVHINGHRLRHTNHNIWYLASKYKELNKHQNALIALFNEPKLITEMVQLFCILKITTNYPLFLAVSKNKESLEQVKKKLDPILKGERGMSWKEFFNGTFSEEKSGTPKAIKPSSAYFQALWKYLTTKKGLSTETVIVFIDQHAEHIDGACKASKELDMPIKVIQYKNIEQVQDALYELLKHERELE